MKKSLILSCILCAACLLSAREISVLTIGNSFANSLWTYLPEMAKQTPDCTLVMDRANLGGCSLERHWKCVQKDDATGSKSYGGGKKSLKDLLTSRKWDVVTLQQVSHCSFKPETFEPYLGNLIAYVKQYAPTAEIVLQQTWAYRADSPFFAKQPALKDGGQNAMADGIEKTYKLYSEKYGLRVIPSGKAIRLVRDEKPYKPISEEAKAALKDMKEPALPDQANSLCTGYYWALPKKLKPDEPKVKKLMSDFNHLNNRGKYIQACTWLAFLFNIDAETITYKPENTTFTDEELALYRKCAKTALQTK